MMLERFRVSFSKLPSLLAKLPRFRLRLRVRLFRGSSASLSLNLNLKLPRLS